MEPELKVCTKCHLEQPIVCFVIIDKVKGYRRGWCKTCDSARVRAFYAANSAYRAKTAANSAKWQKANPEKAAIARRKTTLKSQYGLTPDQYAALFVMQGEQCALCGATEHGRAFGNGRARQLLPGDAPNWPVDHCHTNGHVRGLICFTCNTRLGAYEALLRDVGEVKLLDYLTRPSPVLALPVVAMPAPPPAPRFVAELPPRHTRGQCTVCGKDQHAGGLCFKHYMRARRNGGATDLAGPTTGAAHHKSSLSEAQAREIKFSTEKGVTLAQRFGVKPAVISSIRTGATWKHLTAETIQ